MHDRLGIPTYGELDDDERRYVVNCTRRCRETYSQKVHQVKSKKRATKTGGTTRKGRTKKAPKAALMKLLQANPELADKLKGNNNV